MKAMFSSHVEITRSIDNDLDLVTSEKVTKTVRMFGIKFFTKTTNVVLSEKTLTDKKSSPKRKGKIGFDAKIK
jgi:hypothetical protein